MNRREILDGTAKLFGYKDFEDVLKKSHKDEIFQIFNNAFTNFNRQQIINLKDCRKTQIWENHGGKNVICDYISEVDIHKMLLYDQWDAVLDKEIFHKYNEKTPSPSDVLKLKDNESYQIIDIELSEDGKYYLINWCKI